MAHGSLHQFKAFLERRNERKDKHVGKFEKDASGYKTSDSPQEYDFPELGESELEKVKARIRNKIRKEQRNQLIIFLFVIGLLLVFLSYLFLK